MQFCSPENTGEMAVDNLPGRMYANSRKGVGATICGRAKGRN